jgi:hypothetical protein
VRTFLDTERIPLLSALAAVVVAQALGAGLPGPGPVSTSALAVSLTATLVTAGAVLEPGRSSATGSVLPVALLWSALLAAGAWLLLAANLGRAGDMGLALRLAAGVGAVSLALVGVSRLLEDLLGSRATARLGVLLVLGLLGAGPLWLAPAAERLGGSGLFADTVVAASPLTCLAVLADYDYLRGNWFYTHSVMGSLRFDYPAGWQLGASHLGLGLLMLAGSSLLARRRR